MEIQGKFNTAIVYNDFVEDEAISQILKLCNQDFLKNSKIRIMSDCHAGKGCVIGTTLTVQDKIVPNLVGVDISCGVDVFYLQTENIDLRRLDNFIRSEIPSGFNIRIHRHSLVKNIKSDLEKLKCLKNIDLNRALLSVGTLGGGNHMIELGKDSKGFTYFIVHSGSRHIGGQVAKYYQEQAYKNLTSESSGAKELIATLKKQGRAKDISKESETNEQNRIRALFSLLPVEIDVVNEARVHTWFEKDFGKKIDQLKSCEDAINRWPTTAASVGINKIKGKINVYAPYGLND